MLTLNDRVVSEDKRVKLQTTDGDAGNTLVISLAEPSDAGAYVCTVSATEHTTLTHNVAIRGKSGGSS